MDTFEILKQNSIFSELDDDQIQAVANLAQSRTILKNTLIICEGDVSNSMYIIKSGKVNITITNEDGKEMILSTLVPGDNFGELALLDDAPRSANAIVVEKCELLVLHKEDFSRLIGQNSAIAMAVIRYLCEKIRFLTGITHGLALLDVYGRLVRLLHSLAKPDAEGKLRLEIPLTHKEIAARVGSSREMISRILSELEKGDYISSVNKIITINKKLPSSW